MKSNVYVGIAGSERPGFTNWQLVICALKPKIAAIEADLQHTSKSHKGDYLGVLPVGATFGPFNDDTDWYISCHHKTLPV